MVKVSANRTLLMGFSLSIILLIVTSVASYRSIQSLLSNLWWVEHTTNVEHELANVVSMMKDVETGQRGFLLTGREKFLEPYTSGKDSVWSYVGRAQLLTSDNIQQQKTFDTLDNLIRQKLLLVSNTIEKKRVGLQVSVDSLEQGKNVMDSIRLLIKNMISREEKLMIDRTGRFNRSSSTSTYMLLGSSLLALVITILFYFRIRKDYRQRVALEKKLIEKSEHLEHNINLIDKMAKNIADGNYDTRIDPNDLK